MRRVLMFVVAVALACGAAPTWAQSKPNFAGNWTVVPDPNAPAGGMMGMGPDMTIAQDEKTITITRSSQMGEFKSVYKLDGSDSPNTLSFNGNDMTMMSHAKWDADKLGIKTSMDFNGNSIDTTMTLSLDKSGNLVLESTRPDFQGGGGPVTTKQTYKKK